MKQFFRKALLGVSTLALAMGATSCSDNESDGNVTQDVSSLSVVVDQYLDYTVNNTYAMLANSTSSLYENLREVLAKFRAGTLTQQDLDAACASFFEARRYWEESEAFLYGAATDYGIDPHIDSWPLDATLLATQLGNKVQMERLEGEDGISYAAENLGPAVLGFHGIEFILFRDGKNRTLADIRSRETDAAFSRVNVTGEEELVYATAVAGDLRDRCYQMEVAWNHNAPKAHADRVEELDLPTTVSGTDFSYSENMRNAGKAGSLYTSWQSVVSTILKAGCSNIANEVAGQKMGNPYSGEDINYIESPYSQRSFIDFEGNILSIENTLYGGRADDGRKVSASLIHFMEEADYAGVDDLKSALSSALDALKDCQTLEGGFVNNYKHAKVKVAIDAISTLDTELNKASAWVSLLR